MFSKAFFSIAAISIVALSSALYLGSSLAQGLSDKEEIVGELQDEFDTEEQDVQPITADDAIVDARVTIDELSEIFDVTLEKEDFDSVGGLIVNELGRMPSVGDHVRVNGINLKVLSVAGRRIKKVRVTKVEDHDEETETADAK